MKWIALILVLMFLIVVAGLLLNKPPLLDSPGPLVRLKTYFGSNIAETRPEHEFAELNTPLVPVDKAAAQQAVVAAMRALGWQAIVQEDDQIRAVVVSALFRFKDDVSVRLESTDEGTWLHARSKSRLGRGDLAANSHHLRRLFSTVRRLIEPRTRT